MITKKLIILILMFLLSLNFVNATTLSGLQASAVTEFRFDEGSGVNITNTGLLGSNGSSAGTPIYITGKVGNYAIKADGTYCYNSIVSGLSNNQNFSIGAWYNMTDMTPAADNSMWNMPDQAAFGYQRIRLDSTGTWNILHSNGASRNDINYDVSTNTSSTWYFIVTNYVASGNQELWINGNLVGTITSTGMGNYNENQFKIFSDTNDNNCGNIATIMGLDQLMIFNRTISETEILFLYNDGNGIDLSNADTPPTITILDCQNTTDTTPTCVVQVTDTTGVSTAYMINDTNASMSASWTKCSQVGATSNYSCTQPNALSIGMHSMYFWGNDTLGNGYSKAAVNTSIFILCDSHTDCSATGFCNKFQTCQANLTHAQNCSYNVSVLSPLSKNAACVNSVCDTNDICNRAPSCTGFSSFTIKENAGNNLNSTDVITDAVCTDPDGDNITASVTTETTVQVDALVNYTNNKYYLYLKSATAWIGSSTVGLTYKDNYSIVASTGEDTFTVTSIDTYLSNYTNFLSNVTNSTNYLWGYNVSWRAQDNVNLSVCWVQIENSTTKINSSYSGFIGLKDYAMNANFRNFEHYGQNKIIRGYCNDTSGNTVMTTIITFFVNNTINPTITNFQINGTNVTYQSQWINLSFLAQDGDDLSKCWIGKQNSTGWINNSYLTATTPYSYDTTYKIGEDVPEYLNFTSYCNDTGGNMVSQLLKGFRIADSTNPTIINITLNDTAPHYGDHVNWSCKATDNVGLSVGTCYWNDSSTCYQESANVSTSCGGLSTGSYVCSSGGSTYWAGAGIQCHYGFDNNWGSTGNADQNNVSYLFVNYTKPSNAFASVWKVGDLDDTGSNTNASLAIPIDCWNYNNNLLILRFVSDGISLSSNWSCNNGSWKNLRTNSYNQIVEEAMYWNITDNNFSYTQLSGTSNSWSCESPAITTQSGTVKYGCFVNDTSNNGNYSFSSFSIAADITPPTSANLLTNMTNSTNQGQGVNFTSDLSDNIGGSVYLLYKENSTTKVNISCGTWTTAGNYQCSHILGEEAGASLLFYIFANDSSGNWVKSSLITRYVNDTISPVITYFGMNGTNSTLRNQWINATASVTGNASTCTLGFWNSSGHFNMSAITVSGNPATFATTKLVGENHFEYLNFTLVCSDGWGNNVLSKLIGFNVTDTKVPKGAKPVITAGTYYTYNIITLSTLGNNTVDPDGDAIIPIWRFTSAGTIIQENSTSTLNCNITNCNRGNEIKVFYLATTIWGNGTISDESDGTTITDSNPFWNATISDVTMNEEATNSHETLKKCYDADGDAVAYTVLYENATLVDIGIDGSNALSETAKTDFNGTQTPYIRCTANLLTTDTNYKVTVNNIDDSPSYKNNLTNASNTINRYDTFYYNLTVIDVDSQTGSYFFNINNGSAYENSTKGTWTNATNFAITYRITAVSGTVINMFVSFNSSDGSQDKWNSTLIYSFTITDTTPPPISSSGVNSTTPKVDDFINMSIVCSDASCGVNTTFFQWENSTSKLNITCDPDGNCDKIWKIGEKRGQVITWTPYCNDSLGNTAKGTAVTITVANTLPNTPSNMIWITTGGFFDDTLKYDQIIDYVNVTCIPDADNDLKGCNITVYDPNKNLAVNNQPMVNSSTSVNNFSYTTNFQLTLNGVWNVTVTAYDNDNTATSSRTFTVTGQNLSTKSGWYGYSDSKIFSIQEVDSLSIFSYELYEITANMSTLVQDWTNILLSINQSNENNIKVGLNLMLDFNYSYETEIYSNLNNLSYNITSLKSTPYSATVVYISIELPNINLFNAQNKSDVIDIFSANITGTTNNNFVIYARNYYDSNIDTSYTQATTMIYLNGDNVSIMNQEMNITKYSSNLNRVYKSLANDTKFMVKNLQTNVYDILRGSLTTNANADAHISVLSNNDIIYFNNLSTYERNSVDVSGVAAIIAKDVWDTTNKLLVENDTDGVFNVNATPYSATLILFDDIDHISMSSDTESIVYKATQTGSKNFSYTDGVNDDNFALDNDADEFKIEIFDPNYITSNFISYYGWLNTSYVTNWTEYDIVILDDENYIEVPKLIAQTSDTNFYFYISVADYADTDAWVNDKKAEVDVILALNESTRIHIFFDGLDTGIGGANFETRMKTLIDYVKITKDRKVGLNTYTAYQDFCAWTTPDGFCMKESCVRRWNGASSANPANYSWEDWSLELDRSDWYHNHNVQVLCQAFDNRTKDTYEPFNWTIVQDTYFASLVLGYNSFYQSQPDFNYAHIIKVRDVGTDLANSWSTDDSQTYYRRYSKGIVYFNTSTNRGWIDDGRITNTEACFRLYDNSDGAGDEDRDFQFRVNDVRTDDVYQYTIKANTIDAGVWKWYCVELNDSQESPDGAYKIEGSTTNAGTAADGIYIGNEVVTNTGVHSWWSTTAGNPVWTAYTGDRNWEININSNETYKASLDEFARITQTNSSDGRRTNITLDSGGYSYKAEVWSKGITISIFTNLSYFNGSQYFKLDPLNNSACDTDNPTWNSSTINNEIHKSCIDTVNNQVYVRVAAPSLSSRMYMIEGGDVIPPMVILQSPATGYSSTSSQVTFIFNATDETTITECTLYGNWSGTFVANNTNATITNKQNNSITATIPDGSYIWNVQCNDGYNTNFSISNRTLLVDTTPPIVILTISNHTLEAGVDTTLINTTAYDSGSGIASLSINETYPNGSLIMEGIGVAGHTYQQNHGTYATLGTYNVTAWATDNVGNYAFNSSYYTVQDTIAPVVTIVSPTIAGENRTNKNWVYINFTATDVILDKCFVEWNNGTIKNISATRSGANYYLNITSQPYGIFRYRIYANDSTGNINFTTSNVTLYNLTLQINSPVSYQNVSGNLNITSNSFDLYFNFTNNITLLSAINNSIVRIINNSLLGKSPYNRWNFDYWQIFNTSLVGDGIYKIKQDIVDDFGIYSSTTSNFTIDNTLPSVTLIAPPNNTGFTGNGESGETNINFTYSVVETFLMNCSLVLNGLINSTNLNDQNFSIKLYKGNHNYSIKCYDSAGSSTQTSTYLFSIAAGGYCGDGICGGTENSMLCPQDCAAGQTATGGGSTGTTLTEEKKEFIEPKEEPAITKIQDRPLFYEKDFFLRLFSREVNLNNGVCEDGENWMLHDDCVATKEMVKDKTILNYAWFYRVLGAVLFTLYIFRKDLFTTQNLILLIVAFIIYLKGTF